MASCGSTNQDALLYNTVDAVSQLCQELKIAIPVGKDSLSMKMQWQEQQVLSPISVIISAFATTSDIRSHKTPELVNDTNSKLILLSLDNQQRMGASILQECYNNIGGVTPDIDYSSKLLDMFRFIQALHQKNMILAYHDKSDGGLIATLSEMIFASRIGMDINIDPIYNLNSFLFNEEVGIVLQVPISFLNNLTRYAIEFDIGITILGDINPTNVSLVIRQNNKILINEPHYKLHNSWAKVSHNIQKLRDNPDCANSELFTILDEANTGLFAKTTFNVQNLIAYPQINISKPKVAILREQGINGHIEMAAAFVSAGFDAYDVHTNDILSGKFILNDFVGIIACGGFSYGDVLGAGTGWAKSILLNNKLKDQFSQFFNRKNTFALGVCNGCQMMTQLKSIIPGSNNYPEFLGKNLSQQFEARLAMVEITPSPSILFTGMIGSQLPIVVSHGEGYANFNDKIDNSYIAMRYIDNHGMVTETYPYNPNGSPQGVTSITNTDGRFTIMMPHPERIHQTIHMSWHDKTWNEFSPWFKIFTNARDFVK
ncbi:MAG: phosphoribosylformylglycinamidine synthase subunit PurQ, partial [Burkholderiales bacterium]|nr:phosphoribosylformylglycinamidine synthase subunit PurQ [Burkholderiales bacterium]